MTSIGETFDWSNERKLQVATDCKGLWISFLDEGDLMALFIGINELAGYTDLEKHAVAMMMGEQIQSCKRG